MRKLNTIDVTDNNSTIKGRYFNTEGSDSENVNSIKLNDSNLNNISIVNNSDLASYGLYFILIMLLYRQDMLHRHNG